MNRLIAIALVLGAAYFAYTRYFANPQTTNTSSYSLASVAERPIPKEEFFSLWTDVALKRCDDARANHNLTPEECRGKVKQRRVSCEPDASRGAPDKVGDAMLAKQLGRQYLGCVTPHYFCKGVEVKSEEAAREKCQ
ncbi:hypothetical protein DBR42_09465 [Pelomonas sp. HMWF004]|nr:hypothetical protein DBR42_09465 [Pelomonas sp. HMWF004]